MESIKTNTQDGLTTEKMATILNDAERALTSVQMTLGELNQYLTRIEEALTSVEQFLEQEPRTIHQSKEEDLEQVYQIQYQRFDLTKLDDGPQTGDTMQWLPGYGDRVFEEVTNKALMILSPTLPADEAVRKDSAGYAADNEATSSGEG